MQIKTTIANTGTIWSILRSSLAGLSLLWVTGCTLIPSGEAQPKSRKGDKRAAVEVQIAKAASSQGTVEYTGTTAPLQEVVLRSQIQGLLLSLQVEAGDRIRKGQVLGRQDDDLLEASVNEARAERAAQISEVAGAQSEVGDANTRVAQARLQVAQAQGNVIQLQQSLQAGIETACLEAQQTQADAKRFTQLAKAGATNEQEAEQARTIAQQAQQNLVNLQASKTQQITEAKTAVKTADQLLQAAIAQVGIEERGVDTAQRRVLVQQAVVNQAQKQQSYAVLSSPINGQVMTRIAEEGNFLQPGNDILRLGNFSQIKVIVQVSDRVLPQLQVGQSAQVRLDAFPKQTFRGKIARIPPVANPTSRLLPIEVIMANEQGQIGSGLLARVRFTRAAQTRVQVPESALEAQTSKRGGRPGQQGKPPSAGQQQRQRPENRPTQQPSNAKPGNKATLFVLPSPAKQVTARSVTLGNRSNGQVEIVKGLNPGERFVARTSQPLKDGTVVNVSANSAPLPEDP